eukprot:6186587-Pleurochrysis_carterae.AAC.8
MRMVEEVAAAPRAEAPIPISHKVALAEDGILPRFSLLHTTLFSLLLVVPTWLYTMPMRNLSKCEIINHCAITSSFDRGVRNTFEDTYCRSFTPPFSTNHVSSNLQCHL